MASITTLTRGVNLRLKQRTSYGAGGLIFLALAGTWIILFTFPNLYYELSQSKRLPGMAPLIETGYRLTLPRSGGRSSFSNISTCTPSWCSRGSC